MRLAGQAVCHSIHVAQALLPAGPGLLQALVARPLAELPSHCRKFVVGRLTTDPGLIVSEQWKADFNWI
jgi:hypothetical protein